MRDQEKVKNLPKTTKQLHSRKHTYDPASHPLDTLILSIGIQRVPERVPQSKAPEGERFYLLSTNNVLYMSCLI